MVKLRRLHRTLAAVWLILIACLRCSAVTTNFFEGFESGLANWSAGDSNSVGTLAYWGAVNSNFGGEGTHSGSFKAYCAGVGFAGSTNSPLYQNNMTAYLQRTINLSGYTNATLKFWYKIPSIESNYDRARVFMDGTLLWSRDLATATWTQTNLSLQLFIGGAHTLRFEFSSDGSVANEGWYLDDVQVTDEHTPGPPPANDNFSAARLLLNARGSVVGNNANATSEPGEPSLGNSVWYRWMAPTNGPVTFSTEGSSFDTILCAYTGSVLNALVPAGCDDNSGTNNRSVLTFDAIAGVTYRLSVRGTGDTIGLILLNWNQPNGLGLELLPDLTVLADENLDYLYGWFLDRTEVAGRTLLRLSTATANSGAGPLELRGSSSSPGVNQRIYLSGGGYTDRYAGTFTFHAGHGHLHFDDWVNFHLRAVLANDAVGDIVASGDKISFAIIDLVEYDLGLPGAPAEDQYDGGLTQGISVGWADVYSASLPDQWIDVTDIPSGRYWLEAVVDPFNNIKESNETNNLTRILIDLDKNPPTGTNLVNNSFTNAIGIVGTTAGLTGSNVGADKEPGEPNHGDDSGGASVWYRWTAPANMTVTITTDGSAFDTLLAVYTGTAVNTLFLIAEDDDGGGGITTSLVTFSAAAGVTYRIAVDGFDGDEGPFQLHFNPALNNQFANYVLLAGVNGSTSGSTRGATSQSGEPVHGGANATNSIWYYWVAPTNGPFVFDTFGSSFNTTLAIYEGTNVTALTLVGSDDNGGANGTSRLNFNAAIGATYRIAVAGVNGAQGVVRLSWSGPTPPFITQEPVGTNAMAGSVFSIRTLAGGTQPLSFQWRHQTSDLADNKNLSGALTDKITFHNLQPSQSGNYVVVITNAYGAVTSAPAYVIVLNNPRTVFVEEATGHVAGVVGVPIHLAGVGDEHALQFSLLYDPAILGNPRVANGADTATATLTLNTNQLALGKLGVALTLPAGQTTTAGITEWADVLFDVAGGLTNGTQTGIGFGEQPMGRLVSGTNGTALVALFVAGTLTLETVNSRAQVMILTNGRPEISLSGIAGRTYIIESSTNLTTWTPRATNQANLAGKLSFIDLNVTNRPLQFYRARLE